MRRTVCAGIGTVVVAALVAACGGATFTLGDGGADEGGGSGSSSGGSSSGGGSGSSSSSGGGSGSSSSGSGGSSGGASSGSGSSGSTSSSGGSSSSSGGGPSCPAQPPASGAACNANGLKCEYGASPFQDCNVVATCSQAHWSLAAPTGTHCSQSLPAGCPATFDRVSPGAVCMPNGLLCDYPRGRCVCEPNLGGPVMPIDASVQSTWHCQNPASGCPIPRPPLGTSCNQAGAQCDYGECFIPDATGQECTGGIWVPYFVPCPL